MPGLGKFGGGSVRGFRGGRVILPGQQAYTTPGTYSWVAPAGVTSVCVVCIGGGGYGWLRSDGGGGGGGGGGLGWKNNITVVPGQTYTVRVGRGGNTWLSPNPANASDLRPGPAESSYFINESTVAGLGAVNNQYFNENNAGGTYVGDGGGNGGTGGAGYNSDGSASGGGGGAGGYTGNGGNGQGKLGGRTNGSGGGGAALNGNNSGAGGAGAVRIIWGAGRAYPSTNTNDV